MNAWVELFDRLATQRAEVNMQQILVLRDSCKSSTLQQLQRLQPTPGYNPGHPGPREPVAGLRAGQGGALLCQLMQNAVPNAINP